MSKAGTLNRVKILELAGEGTVILGLTLLFPFLIHLLPSWDDSPLGAHLLPIFYAPLGALLMGRMGIVIISSALAPWINHVLLGQPAVPMAVVLCLELGIFGLVGGALMKRHLPFPVIGPLAYLVALFSAGTLGSLLQLAGLAFPLNLMGLPGILLNAVPGLIILALIGYWLDRHRPQGA